MKKMNIAIVAAISAIALSAAGCGAKEAAPAASDTGETVAETFDEAQDETEQMETQVSEQVASEDEKAAPIEVVKEGMEPVYADSLKDGVYPVTVDSSSNMFRIVECELTVADGAMSAVMTMNGTGYLKLYMGTGEAAAAASEDAFIPFAETKDGVHTFTVPVEALDMGIDCSAFSKRKEKWYDRVLVFRADSLPAEAFAEGLITTAESLRLEDGNYTIEVTLEGGSGKASVESPAALRAEGGKVYATIIFSSPNYDYMKVNDEKFNTVNTEGNSTFEIPVENFDRNIPVIANTIAMSEPHEIDYTLLFDSATIKKAD